MAMPLHVSRCMFGIGASSYVLERWVCFFSRMVKTPVGVSCPFDPELIDERPTRMQLRKTFTFGSENLTSTPPGPAGEIRGFHQYSPGLSGPVDFPVAVPFVWNDGCGIGAVEAGCEVIAASAMVAKIRSFD